MTDTGREEGRLRGLVARAARHAEGALPFVIVLYVLAAAAVRVLAIGNVWDGLTGIDAVSLYDPGWWWERVRGLGAFIGNPAILVSMLLLAASLAVPVADVERPPAWFIHGLRAATVCALACLASERDDYAPSRLVPILLGGVALLIATRSGKLPSWQVAVGAWVLTCRMGWTTRVFSRWHGHEWESCMPLPVTLEEIAPACIAFHLCAAFALAPQRGAPHAGLRRLAAIWALFCALDAGVEVAVGHGLTQREPWFAWVTAWSIMAHAIACGTLLALAVSSYRTLRARLFDTEPDPQVGDKAAVALVFGLAMLAPVLTRHPMPWDVTDVGFDAVADMPDVTSLWAFPSMDLDTSRVHTILVADRGGVLYDARSGDPAAEFTLRAYGLIMDQFATVADFTQLASRVLQQGGAEVRWVLPVPLDEEAAAAIPARYAIGDIAQRQLVDTNVAVYLASEYPWRFYHPPGDPGVHFVQDALGDQRLLRTLRDEPPTHGYHVRVGPAYPLERHSPPGYRPQRVPDPPPRVFRDSAHTVSARLVPLLGGLALAYFAFLLSIQRDLARLRRERASGLWLNTSRHLAFDAELPRFPPWITVEDAPFSRMDGSPFREARTACAASVRAAREHARLRLLAVHHVGGAFVGVLLLFVAATWCAAGQAS